MGIKYDFANISLKFMVVSNSLMLLNLIIRD